MSMPWYGDLPERWEACLVKNLFHIQKNIAGAEGYDVLSITQRGIKVKNIESNEGQMAQSYAKYQVVNIGDFAMNHMDLLTGWVDCAKVFGVTSPDYRVFVLDDKEQNADYLLIIMQLCYTRRIFYAYGRGAASEGRWRLPRKEFLNFSLPLPPRVEQDQIVRYLHWKVSRINKLIKAKRRQIELFGEFITNKINNTLCYSTDKTTKVSKCVTKIGSGKTPRGGVTVYVDTGTLFIRSQNVYPSGLVTDNAYYITDEIDESMKGSRVFQGDVLLNITGGSIGRSCVYSFEGHANVNQHVCIIRPNQDILLPEYLAYFLNSPLGQTMINTSQNEGNRQSLTFGQIGAFDIPLPQINEQEQLLHIIHGMDNPIKSVVGRLNEEIIFFIEYRNRLISDVVTGKLDVRGVAVPEYETVEDDAGDAEIAGEYESDVTED